MWLLALAATVLIGCGNVAATASDARPSDGPAGDAASNPCAPATCLLSDEFDGTGLDPSKWGMTASTGNQSNIKVSRPSWFRLAWYAAVTVLGLRRSNVGGFGSTVPEETSRGGYYG